MWWLDSPSRFVVCWAARQRRFGRAPPTSSALLLPCSSSLPLPLLLLSPDISHLLLLRLLRTILRGTVLTLLFFVPLTRLSLRSTDNWLVLDHITLPTDHPSTPPTHLPSRNTMAAAPVTSNPHSEAPSEKQKLNGTSSSEATANSLDNLDNPRFKELQR